MYTVPESLTERQPAYFIHVGVLHVYVRFHVEESNQSLPVECFHDHIERYRGILTTSLGQYFEPFLSVC